MSYRGSLVWLHLSTLDSMHRAAGGAYKHMDTSVGTADIPGIERSIHATRAGFRWMPALVNLLRVAKDSLPDEETRVRDLLATATSLIDSSAPSATSVPSLPECCFRPAGLTRWQANRIDEYIDAHMCEMIRMASLASVTRLSTSYFFHAFRTTFGDSPYRYVLRRRVEFAKALMMSSARPLADIAVDSGFADQPHMTRQFKKIVGVTPAVWRRAGSRGRLTGVDTAPCGKRMTPDSRAVHRNAECSAIEGPHGTREQDEFSNRS